MIRPFTCLCMVLAASAGLYLYQAKHRTRMLDREIGGIVQEAEATRARTGVLKAEWERLNQPDRLADLANRFLTLKPLAPTQFVTLADLDRRLPPVQLPAPAEPAPVVAAAEPAPPTPVVAAPVQLAAARPAAPHPAAEPRREIPAEPRREIAVAPLALATPRIAQSTGVRPISAALSASPRSIETRFGGDYAPRSETGATYAAMAVPRAYARFPVASSLGAPTPPLPAPVPVLPPYASPPGGQ